MNFIRFVLKQSGEVRRLLLSSMAVGGLSGAFSVALLALIVSTLESEDGANLASLGLAFVGCCILVSVTRVASVYLLSLLSEDMVKRLRLELSRQIIATALRRVEVLGAHRLLATLTEDINGLTVALGYVPATCINCTIILGSLIYLAWLNLSLFAVLIMVALVGALTYQVTAQLGIRKYAEARERQDALFKLFRGLTEGIKELKMHQPRSNAFLGSLSGTADVIRRLRTFAAFVYGSASGWGHLLFFVAIGVILYGQSYYSRISWFRVDESEVIGFIMVLIYLITPLQNFLDHLPTLGRADVAAEKVRQLGFVLGSPERGPLGDFRIRNDWRHVELVDVTHSYYRESHDRNFRLGPINFVLEPGELVFVVGGNGSGKTTLVKILTGLYVQESGEIRIDGRVVNEENLLEYRQLFSVAFSDFYLFDELLGLQELEVDDKAREYLRRLQLEHKVKIQDGKLSTVDLSRGQRKRLALLVSYLENRPIYVFDEWAADQDPYFKEIFYREIVFDLRRRGKAVVVITHDEQYFHLADRMVKLMDGKMVDDRHDHVMHPTAVESFEAIMPENTRRST